MPGAAECFLNLGWSSFMGRGGETSSLLSVPDSTMLAALDKTSRGDSGSGMSSLLAITITTCRYRVRTAEILRTWKEIMELNEILSGSQALDSVDTSHGVHHA